DKDLVVSNETEAVKLIYAMRSEGNTLHAIADALNKQDIATVKGVETFERSIHPCESCLQR
ncbi:MAG: recombinase family protein, partial [Nitrospirae bacterium]|nr:recombinase family protein [Nitrospirota bacterium]